MQLHILDVSVKTINFIWYLYIYPSFLKNGLIIISLLAKTTESKHFKNLIWNCWRSTNCNKTFAICTPHGHPLSILTCECNYEHLIRSPLAIWKAKYFKCLSLLYNTNGDLKRKKTLLSNRTTWELNQKEVKRSTNKLGEKWNAFALTSFIKHFLFADFVSGAKSTEISKHIPWPQ